MPKCLDCGNTEAFVHHVSGTETRYYGEDETITDTEYEQVESEAAWCENCESANIVFDPEPEGEPNAASGQ